MTNKIDLSGVFDVYSLRDRPPGEMDGKLTEEFRNRVWLFCKAMVHPYDYYPQAGHKMIADFWMTLRDKLRYRHGSIDLVDRHSPTVVTEMESFLSQCSDEHFLDFIEMFFQSEELPMHFSDSELSDAVGNVNRFFALDNLPYSLTEFSISKSRTLRPRIRRLLRLLSSMLRPARRVSPQVLSSHTQPPSLPIRIPKVEAYPRIIRVESQIMHQTAIKPALALLADPTFTEANREFLGALEDYRNDDYPDCVVKCGSAFESVMKIICEENDWPSQRDAGKLLNTVLSKTELPGFLRQPLIQIATIRNELGSAHGAGTQPKAVPNHLAQYTINATASAILLLVEETDP